MSGPSPLTVAQIKEHPEFPYVNWNLQPTQKGKLPVAVGRGGPLKIDYEVHGHGPIRLVFVLGLGSLKTSWQRQTRDFGHNQSTKYSCLVMDNRGIGGSEKPWMRYSTSEMAKDVIEVLDHLSWKADRSLHVIGISMGGMIAQEICLLIPERIASVSFVSTAAAIKNTVGFTENLRNRINLFIPRSMDQQLENVKYNLFSPSWLELPDTAEHVKAPFPTNGDRIAATEVNKRSNTEAFTRAGFICQAIAAGWHYKSPEQLADLANKVGRERIQVIHGGIDRMVTFPHGEILLAGLGGEERGVTVHFEPGQGHVIPIELRQEFNRWVEGLIEKTQRLDPTSSSSG